MKNRNLWHFIEDFEQQGKLVRIIKSVSPELEITEITDRIVKSENQNKALLFENNSTKFPLLINLFGTEKRMASIFGVSHLNDIGKEIEEIFKSLTTPRQSFFDKLKLLPQLKEFASWMPKSVSGRGICQQNVMKNPDLSVFPILKCWPADGGKFITLPLVHTRDPETGNRNLGMYRMQVFDKKTTGMHWHIHKGGAAHFDKYKKLKKRMPVAVALGGDPVYSYVATAPLPDNVDEYILAGFLRKQRVELVKCLTQDIEVPADCDIVIEGFVDTEEELAWEGPFGDHTGFYSLPDWYPKFHITAITYKNNAVYPTTVVGIPPQEDAWLGKATERIFLPLIKQTLLPEIVDMNLPFVGVAHNLAVVSIEKKFPGHAWKIAHALWGAGQMMFNKILIIVDLSMDVNNYEQIAETVLANCDFGEDLYFSQGNMDVLDHAARKKVFGGKLLIDATKKTEGQQKTSVNFSMKSDSTYSCITFLKGHILFVKTSDFEKTLPEVWNKFNSQTLKMDGIKSVIFSDIPVDSNEKNFLVWLTLSNIDISTDVLLIKEQKILIIDARNKPKIKNSYGKWPRMLTNHPDVIKKVDSEWNNYGFRDPVISPSVKILEKYPFTDSYFLEE
ncbi:MAG: menaquinone biosynthesis decarboxylase [Bacteroidales bacterium]|nr:menaquinone biosynthesis decarboxylase [Bacteroidales bacterium]